MGSPALVPFRALFMAAAIIVGFLFLLGFLHWNKGRPACMDGNHWTNEWIVTYAVGKLEWRQHPYGCDKSQQYDPKEFKSGTTIYVPPVSN